MKSKMTCPSRNQKASDLLLDYSAGRLDHGRAEEVRRHLMTCDLCADQHQAQVAVWDALSAWEPVSVSTDFNRRLWRRIDHQVLEPWHVRLRDSLRITGWKPVLPLAAALVAVIAGFVMDHPGHRFPGLTPGEVSALEAEQVEQTLEDIQLLHQFNSTVNETSGQF